MGEHEQPRHASYAATSASKLAVACDAKLLHDIQSSIEELRASQQHNQQMLIQCQAQSAATQTELHEMNNRSLPTDAIDIREVLNKCADSCNKKIELFAAEQSSKLRAVSHSLECLTGDFEIL